MGRPVISASLCVSQGALKTPEIAEEVIDVPRINEVVTRGKKWDPTWG